MSILIKGLNMPKEGYRQIFITSDGKAIYFPSTPQNGEIQYEVVHVPPHGRVSDVDAADEYAYDELEIANGYLTGWEAARNMQKIYQNAPTIIEAEEGEPLR